MPSNILAILCTPLGCILCFTVEIRLWAPVDQQVSIVHTSCGALEMPLGLESWMGCAGLYGVLNYGSRGMHRVIMKGC